MKPRLASETALLQRLRRRARDSLSRVPVAHAAPFALLVLLIALYDHRYHEFWRDEACALLEASAVPWTGFLHAMRLEGIPPLYHALLKVLASVLPNEIALLTAGSIGFGALLFGTYRLVDSIASSRRAAFLVTLALSLTYTYAYELGVMIRQYSLGLGLALLATAHLRRAIDSPDPGSVRKGALAAGLSALVAAHSACVAGAALFAFGLVSLVARRPLRTYAAIFLTLPCFALVVYLGLPWSERTLEANILVHRTAPDALRSAGQLLVEGLMPNDWWRAESFLAPGQQTPFAALRSFGFWGMTAALGLATLSRLAEGPRRAQTVIQNPPLRAATFTFELTAATLGCLPLLYVMVYRYWGGHRHQLFLGIPAVITAAAFALRSPTPPLARLAQRLALLAMIPWLALQLWMASVNLLADLRHPFSDTKAAAAALPHGAHVVGRDEWQSASLLFWRPDIHYRSTSGNGRPYRYTLPDRDWHKLARVPPLIAAECLEAPDSVIYAGSRDALAQHASCAAPLPFAGKSLLEHPFTWETFNLHRIDCACVAAQAPPDR